MSTKRSTPLQAPRFADYRALRRNMAWRLKELRDMRSLTQEELAAKISVDPRTVQGLEDPEADGPVKTWHAVANGLKVDITELFVPAAVTATHGGESRASYGRVPTPRNREATQAQLDALIDIARELDEESAAQLVKHAQALQDARKVRGK